MSSSSSTAPPPAHPHAADNPHHKVSSTLSALIQATAGGGGGAFASVVLAPLDLVKTRIQAGQTKSAGMWDAAVEIYKEEGIAGFYRGLGVKTLESALKNFTFFYCYEFMTKLARARGVKMTAGTNLIIGYIAGVVNMCLTMPLEVLATKLQVNDEPLDVVLKKIMKNEGFAGLYRGFWFNIMLCSNPAIVNTVFDVVKREMKRMKDGAKLFLTPLEAFMLGFFAKAVATVLTYPLVRLKTLVQAKSKRVEQKEERVGGRVEKKNEVNPFTSPSKKGAKNAKNSPNLNPSASPTSDNSDSVAPTPRLGPQTHKEEDTNTIEFYFRGLQSALFKTCLQQALMFSAKDQIALFTTMLITKAADYMKKNGRRHKMKAISGRPLH